MSQTCKDVLIITLLITLFFGAFLGSRPLTVPDEGRYAEIPREMLQTHDFITPHVNNIKYFEKPPLFYWLQTLNLKLFGENLWSVRFGTLMMGIIGCLMTYFTGKNLYNRQTGLLSAAILATSTLYYGLSRFITLDMMLSVWLTGCLFSFMLGVKTQNKYYFWAMYIFAALATMTKGFIGVIFPGVIIFLWIAFTNKWKELPKYQLVMGVTLFTLIALPWHILVQLKNPEFFNFYIIEQQILRYFKPITNHDEAIWYLPSVLFAGFFPWSVFLIGAIAKHFKQLRQNFKNNNELLFLIIWPTVIFAFFWPSQSQLSPYLLPMFPPMSLLLASSFEKKQASRNLFFLLTSIFSIGIALIAYIKWPAPQPYLSITAITLALSGLISYLFFHYKSTMAGILSLMIFYSLFLISLNFSYPPTDKRSVLPLAQTLKPYLKANTIVASYKEHYQDLPFYLKQPILLVEWTGELKHGIQHQDTTGLAMREKDFWKYWQKPDRMFMIMSLKNLRRLKEETTYNFYTLAKTERNVLVSNKVIN